MIKKVKNKFKKIHEKSKKNNLYLIVIGVFFFIFLTLYTLPFLTKADEAIFNSVLRIGGGLADYSSFMKIGPDNNIYVTGYFNGTVDFNPGSGINNLTSAGSGDIFVLKLDSSGNFVWAKNMGGTSFDNGASLDVDSNGNVYITGDFMGTADFNPGSGTYNLTSEGLADIFISKLDSNGNFLWAHSFGAIDWASNERGTSIGLDSNGNVYTTGFFQDNVDFDPGPNEVILHSSGGMDVFVLKLDSSGNFVWGKKLGSPASCNEKGNSLKVSLSGNIYITGFFCNTADFDPGPGTNNLSSLGGSDIFISKLDLNGNFVWAKSMGGTSDDNGNSIKVDSSENVYTIGNFQNTVDFDPGIGTNIITSSGSYDIFISKLDSSGNFVWAKNMGGSSSDSGSSIQIDSNGNLYTTGKFNGTADFNPGSGTNNLTSVGESDVFVSKLNSSGDYLFANSVGGSSFDVGNSLDLNSSGSIYVTGNFYGTADFDPGIGVYNLISTGDSDMFITNFSQTISEPPPPTPSTSDLAYWINHNETIPPYTTSPLLTNVISPVYINDLYQSKSGSLIVSGLKVKGKGLFNLGTYSLKINLKEAFGGSGGGNGTKYLLCCKNDPEYPLLTNLAYWDTITPPSGDIFGGWKDEGTRVALSSPYYHIRLGNYTSLYEGVNSSNRILFTSENGNEQVGNTFAGMFSGGNLDSGSFNNNTAIGFQALRKLSNTASFSGNTALGFKSMGSDNSGNNNTALGSLSLYSNSTGSNNTGIGYKALYNNTTGNNNTALGYNAGPSAGNLDNTTAIGANATVGISNTMIFGDSNVLGWGFGTQPGTYAISVYGAGSGGKLTKQGEWVTTSDISKKHDITNLSYGLEEVMKLRPVDFRWNRSNTKDIGFIAQEVKEILPDIVAGKEGEMSIPYSKFGPILVNATKEQQQQLDNDKIKIEEFEKQLNLLEN